MFVLRNYGNVASSTSAPILSTLMKGCLERGRDIYNAGSESHLVGCMFITFANTVDSLYAIKHFCFGPDQKFTLDEMRLCLSSNWGLDLKDPQVDTDDLPGTRLRLHSSALMDCSLLCVFFLMSNCVFIVPLLVYQSTRTYALSASHYRNSETQTHRLTWFVM